MEDLDQEYEVSIFELDIGGLTKERLCAFAQKYDCTPETAIDKIVSEWTEDREKERLNVESDDSLLGSLANKIETVDKLVDEVLLKLKRASL